MALQDSAPQLPTRSHPQTKKQRRTNRLHAIRDAFEMVSGIFLDLRGDLADSISESFRPVRTSIRRMKIGRNI